MTRFLALAISRLLWPIVVCVLAWRYAFDRLRDPDVEIVKRNADLATARAIVRLPSGRELAYGTSGWPIHGWRDSTYSRPPEWIRERLDVALTRADQLREEQGGDRG